MFELFKNKELTITKKRKDELEIECDDLRSDRRKLKEQVEDDPWLWLPPLHALH